jgi:hypothetical protein
MCSVCWEGQQCHSILSCQIDRTLLNAFNDTMNLKIIRPGQQFEFIQER